MGAGHSEGEAGGGHDGVVDFGDRLERPLQSLEIVWLLNHSFSARTARFNATASATVGRINDPGDTQGGPGSARAVPPARRDPTRTVHRGAAGRRLGRTRPHLEATRRGSAGHTGRLCRTTPAADAGVQRSVRYGQATSPARLHGIADYAWGRTSRTRGEQNAECSFAGDEVSICDWRRPAQG